MGVPKLRVPQRRCIGCRRSAEKGRLIRIVRVEQKFAVDPKGRAPGRGAYLHGTRDCLRKMSPGQLLRALRISQEELGTGAFKLLEDEVLEVIRFDEV